LNLLEKDFTMFIQPYLFFDGRCDEALDFYKKMLGAEVTFLMRFKDSPDPQAKAGCGPGMDDKVMHCNVRIRDTELMVSDGGVVGQPKFDGFSLTLNVADAAEANKLFTALGDGGQVQMPLMETFFAESFGMVVDKFGVSWMILAAKQTWAQRVTREFRQRPWLAVM
jgi:PhnB protein